MTRKKILIVSASFYPENSPRSFRTTELAKELSRAGHDVTVLFPLRGNDYAAFEKVHHLKIEDLGALSWKEVKLKGGRLEFLFRRALRRLLQQLFEWPNIELAFKVARALKHKRDYDLLISVAVPYPIHWGVAKIRNDQHKIAGTWIADCGDPYMGDRTDSFRKIFYFKYLEKWFFRKADCISIPFEGARSAYYPEFHNKIRIIPQGFRMDELNLPPYQKATDHPVFAYAGRFIPGKRDPEQLLNYLCSCQRHFKFIVYTSQHDMLMDAKISLGVKLDLRGVVPRETLLKELAAMDFLVNFDNNTKGQLPSKLIDYAITGRPVLNVSACMDLKLISDFMDGNYEMRMELPPLDRYDIREVAENFVRLHLT